jgi:hypothetical protein
MRFPAHADALHEAGRGLVAGITAADDPVPPEAAEPEVEQGGGRFGGQTPPLVVGVEHETHLTLAVLPMVAAASPGCW